MLLFSFDELKQMGRGRGVVLMSLDEAENMTATGFSGSKSVTVTGQSRSGSIKSTVVSGAELKKHIIHRARKGCLIPGKMIPTAVK